MTDDYYRKGEEMSDKYDSLLQDWKLVKTDCGLLIEMPRGYFASVPSRQHTEAHLAIAHLIADAPDLRQQVVALTLLGWTIEKRWFTGADVTPNKGWVWTELNGKEHFEFGRWDELPPWPDSAREAVAKYEESKK